MFLQRGTGDHKTNEHTIAAQRLLCGMALAVVLAAGSAHAMGMLAMKFVDRGSDADALQILLTQDTATPADYVADDELRGAVQALYYARAFRPLWVDRQGLPTAAAVKTIDELYSADRRGLDAHDYADRPWSQRLSALKAGAGRPERMRFDLALTVQAMRYATHLHRGRIDPRSVDFKLDVTPKRLDLPTFTESLAAAQEPALVFTSIEPNAAGYQRLKAALSLYQSLYRQAHDVELPPLPKKKLEPGDMYVGREQLHARLRQLGDLVDVERDDFVGPPSPRYEGALVTAVQRFQGRHGLEVDGRIGEQTFIALNTPVSQRIAQIRMAMERWRWLPTTHAESAIVVNIADFNLRAFDESGQPALQMPVVVGRAARTQTPVLVEDMRTVVFRPTWSVPLSIIRNEMLPRAAREPGYFSANGFDVVGAEDQSLTPDTIARLRSGKASLRQRPGAGNALGRVKFLFPNEYSVYLHDTPSTSLFAKARRDLSHGCVRVGDPEALAKWVLRNRSDWPASRIHEAMTNGGGEIAVAVDPPIPVYVIYLTAMVGADGQVMFFDDLYGHDQTLMAAFAERAQGRIDATAALAPDAAAIGRASTAAAAMPRSAAFASTLATAQVSSVDDARQSAAAEYANNN